MAESTTPAPACTRSAAPDRHPPKGAVPPARLPFAVRRPASTARAHAGTAPTGSTISADTVPRRAGLPQAPAHLGRRVSGLEPGPRLLRPVHAAALHPPPHHDGAGLRRD